MYLTLYSDYSLRVLIYLGLHPDRLCSIAEIAQAYGISRNHLLKVVNELANLGFVQSTRGRGGGLTLGRDPSQISLGEVIRQTEPLHLVECFDAKTNTCRLAPSCELKRVLREATGAFLATLDRYTLADVLRQKKEMLPLLQISILSKRL